MTAPDPLAEGRALREAQAVEYGSFVATEAIYVGGALAYNIGDAVPVSNVKLHGYDSLGVVAKTTTKAAAAAINQAAASAAPIAEGA